MNTLLTVNLSTKTATSGKKTWVPPVLTFGESLILALRFTQDIAGATIEPVLDIRGMRAGIGEIDLRPESGTWALQIGAGSSTSGNTTDPQPHDVSAAVLTAAINAKSAVVTAYGLATVERIDGSWLITFASAVAAVPLTVRKNSLRPLSLLEVAAAPIDTAWVHALRLVQSPVAFSDVSAQVLPPPPSVTRVSAGGNSGGFTYNEIQSLYVPPDFRATFTLALGLAKTGELAISDTPETIQAALEAVLGVGNIVVSQGNNYSATIEFTGALKGAGQTLLVVTALAPPPGDLTFTLPLNSAALLARLRAADELSLPLEVRISTATDDVVTEQVAFRTQVTLQRPVVWPDMATVPNVDWLRPESPETYVPFSIEPVITGQQFARAEIGDASATVFTIAHGLATRYVFVWVRENMDGGRQLIEGTDYRVTIVDAASVTVTALTGAPSLNAWLAVVVSAQTVAAFANGLTVTIGQVTGLSALLGSIETAVTTLQALVPTTPLGTTGTAPAVISIDLPDVSEVFPGIGTVAAPPNPLGNLLPALHVASPTSLTALPLPSISAATGVVYQNNSGAPIVLGGGGHIHSSSVAVAGYFGGDGRRLYPLSKAGSTNSFFPRDFERELFMFEVNAQMLRAGSTLAVAFVFDAQLLGAVTRAQWLLVVEHGTAPSDTSPATTAPNLQAITWNATPLLSQRIILGENKTNHPFGFTVIRAGDGTLSANKTLYGLTTAADAVPASPDAAFRCRLINFDTENAVAKPKGALAYDFTSATATISYS